MPVSLEWLYVVHGPVRIKISPATIIDLKATNVHHHIRLGRADSRAVTYIESSTTIQRSVEQLRHIVRQALSPIFLVMRSTCVVENGKLPQRLERRAALGRRGEPRAREYDCFQNRGTVVALVNAEWSGLTERNCPTLGPLSGLESRHAFGFGGGGRLHRLHVSASVGTSSACRPTPCSIKPLEVSWPIWTASSSISANSIPHATTFLP